jgi:hypothetical protein
LLRWLSFFWDASRMKSSGLAYSFISSRGEQAMRDKQLHASPRLFPLPRLSRNFFSFAPHP